MRKFLSLALALVILLSVIPAVSAAGNWDDGTVVSYTGTGTESWTVTVPATMTAGTSADVVANGTWASNRKLVVTADDSVTMTNREDGATRELTVTFADIGLEGSNTAAVTATEQVAVSDMSDVMFGIWEGHFTYTAEMVNNVQLITFTIEGTEYQAEEGMTWAQWCESDYNKDGFYVEKVIYSDNYYVFFPGTTEHVSINAVHISSIVIPSDWEIEAGAAYRKM